MPTNQVKWSVLSQLEDDGNQTYEWTGRRLQRVRLGNGKIIEYEYYNDRKLRSRRIKNGIGDPGTLETFTSTINRPSDIFTVSVNGQVTESYTFSNAALTRFSIGSMNYEVDCETGNNEIHSITKIFQVIAPPGGTGPVNRILKQAFIYDALGNIYIPLDLNMQPGNEKIIPRFLFLSQYYDVDTGLYYMWNYQWYHPGLRVMADGQFPVFLPRPAPQPHPGYIYPAPPWWAPPRYPRKTIGDVAALLASSLPESVSSRISGLGRIISGGVVFTVSLPADITVVGLVIGVPMAVWSGDQIGTGLTELWSGRHQTSLIGRGIESVSGNGTLGKTLTLAADTIPGMIFVPASGVARLSRTTEVAEVLPRLAVAESTVAATQLAPRAAAVQQAVTQTARPLQAVEQILPQASQVERALPLLSPERVRRISQRFPVRPFLERQRLLAPTADELLEGARCMHLMERDAKVAVQIQLSGRIHPFFGHNSMSNKTLKYMQNPATGKLGRAPEGFPIQLKLNKNQSRGHAEGEAAFWSWVSGARGEEAYSAVVRVTERLCCHCRHQLPTALYQLGTRELSVGILNEGLSVMKLTIPTPASLGGNAKAWSAFLSEMEAVSRPSRK